MDRNRSRFSSYPPQQSEQGSYPISLAVRFTRSIVSGAKWISFLPLNIIETADWDTKHAFAMSLVVVRFFSFILYFLYIIFSVNLFYFKQKHFPYLHDILSTCRTPLKKDKSKLYFYLYFSLYRISLIIF